MSERDWKQTPTLDEFNAMYDEDDNIWWRIACGHHQNLYEAAVERYQTAEAQIQRVREAIEYAEEWAEALEGKNVSTPVVPCADLRCALDGGNDE